MLMSKCAVDSFHSVRKNFCGFIRVNSSEEAENEEVDDEQFDGQSGWFFRLEFYND